MKSLFAMLLLGMVPLAHGSTVFDNGSPDLLGGLASDVSTPFVVFDDVSLGSSATVRSVQWWGVYYSDNTPLTDAFTIRLYVDVAGAPSASAFATYAVSATRQDTGTLVLGALNNYLYSANIPDTLLASGTYWISIVNDTTNDTNDNWYWATSQSTGNAIQLTTTNSGEMAFVLSDTVVVPEPGTLLLGVAGFAALALLRRRRA